MQELNFNKPNYNHLEYDDYTESQYCDDEIVEDAEYGYSFFNFNGFGIFLTAEQEGN